MSRPSFLPPEDQKDELISRTYRIRASQDARLKRLSDRLGISEAQLLRHLLDSALTLAESELADKQGGGSET